MNYRHAFHAGNAGDCVKHALLVWLLRAMARKPAPFFVLDTHAGIGAYDLGEGTPAARTGEWRSGIGRLLDGPRADDPRLADYLGVVRTLGLYPGSPAIVLALLRANDRLAACELHPDDATLLRRRIGADPRVGVHHRDGYEAVRALLPPPERRALVLIDPPYEQPDEFDQIAEAIITARTRCAPSVIATWYPIKHRAPVRAFHDRLRDMGLRDLVAAELLLREPLDPARLNGSGMLVATPPYRFETEVAPILDALLAGLGDGEPGAGARIERLADE